MYRNLSKLISQNLKTVHTASVIRHSALTKTTEQNGVREIMLSDPKTRNSLSIEMMTELKLKLTTDLSNENLRVIILSAEPGRVFSSGHNLKEFVTNENDDIQSKKEIFTKLTEIILAIRAAPVPVIAKVDGLAAAAGCQLVASCDLLVCSENSSFSLPGAEVGIFCSTPGVAVSRVMPRMKSSYMLFSGLPINANDAYIGGLVSCVVPADKLDEEIEKICTSIIRKSRAVIKLGKEFYYKHLEMRIEDAYQAAENVMIENLGTHDGKEGICSFIEKRKPNWSHS